MSLFYSFAIVVAFVLAVLAVWELTRGRVATAQVWATLAGVAAVAALTRRPGP